MNRRAQVLAEMGLSPIWRLRTKEQKNEWIPLKAAVSGCVACGLHKGRTQTVFGAGDEHADWLLVGEAPGSEEDRVGEPFGNRGFGDAIVQGRSTREPKRAS